MNGTTTIIKKIVEITNINTRIKRVIIKIKTNQKVMKH